MKKINKKYMFGFLAFAMVAFVSAGLVSYLSNTVTEDIDIESPFYIDTTIGLDIDIQYAGDDVFALIKITNQAERDITADVEIGVSPDVVGIAMAITEDINYCFKGQGDMTGVANCEMDFMTWMSNNIDWNDWYASEVYSDSVFFSDLVINHGGDSFHDLGYTGNDFILPGMTFGAGETVYGIVYVATDPALEPITYDFDMTIVPTA